MSQLKRLILTLSCLALTASLVRAQAPATSPATQVTHRVLKSGCNSGSVAIVGRDGAIEWEYPIADETSDAWLLPTGNIIFAYKHGVREVSPDKKTLWEYPAPDGAEVHSCQPLPGGLFLVGEAHQDVGYLCEMDRTGKVHKCITIPEKGDPHSQYRQVRKTPQGTYLVTYQRDGGKAREFDADGRLLREFPGGRFVAVRLPDGNTLVACGDEHRVIEVDPAGKIVWQVTQDEIPGNKIGFASGLQRLPNGNTVITNWSGHGGLSDQPQVFEITRNKQLVWTLKDARLKMISSIQILDEPADPALGGILR